MTQTFLHRATTSLLRRSDGMAAVEFALTVPVLLVSLLGVIEVGRLLWTENALHYAVEDAARCMALGTCGAGGPAGYAATAAPGMTFPSSDFTATTVACGSQVTASHTFQFLTTLVNFDTLLPGSMTLTAQSCHP